MLGENVRLMALNARAAGDLPRERAWRSRRIPWREQVGDRKVGEQPHVVKAATQHFAHRVYLPMPDIIGPPHGDRCRASMTIVDIRGWMVANALKTGPSSPPAFPSTSWQSQTLVSIQ